jgi:hypothetical protein
MTITVSVPDQLVYQAASKGMSIEAYVEQLVRQAATQSQEPSRRRKRTPAEAAAHLRAARQGVTLGGLETKDPVNEGRKY